MSKVSTMDLLRDLTTAILAWQSVVYTPGYLRTLRKLQPDFAPEDAATFANDVLVELQDNFAVPQYTDWVEAFVTGEKAHVCNKLLRVYETPLPNLNCPVRRLFSHHAVDSACRRAFDFRLLAESFINEAKGARGPRNNWVSCVTPNDARRPLNAVYLRFRSVE